MKLFNNSSECMKLFNYRSECMLLFNYKGNFMKPGLKSAQDMHLLRKKVFIKIAPKEMVLCHEMTPKMPPADRQDQNLG